MNQILFSVAIKNNAYVSSSKRREGHGCSQENLIAMSSLLLAPTVCRYFCFCRVYLFSKRFNICWQLIGSQMYSI